MHGGRGAVLGCALLVASASASGQADFRVYAEHPRLFLEPERLVRLRRDVDRQSLRWQALRDLIAAGTEFPEQPLVDALRFQVEGAREPGGRAVAWSRRLAQDGIRSAADLRLAAIVYDWCYPLFDDAEREAVRDAVAAAVLELLPGANLGPGLLRSAILASLAVAGDWDGSEAALAELLEMHWGGDVRPVLEAGGFTDDGAELIAVLEASLAIRHNLEVDLWRPAMPALKSLAASRLLAYFPLDVETPEGVARRPARFGADEARAGVQAPLYRLADMLLVAYESNLREFQFIQGWVRDDSYALGSPMAAPYEFLWLNPYLPGLAPQSAPLLAHDAVRGRLYGRFAWERPATWIGYADGTLQMLGGDGLSASGSLDDLAPLYFPDAVVVPVSPPAKVLVSWQPDRATAPESATILLIGLRAGERYFLKAAGRDARVVEAGSGGIVALPAVRDAPPRNRIDLRKRVRIEVKPALKAVDPRRPRPTLNR